VTRRLTRRQTMVTVGGGLLAGCLSSRPQFWEDPPSFDATGLDGVLDNPLPDRPQLVPVSFEPAVAAQFVDRVERLLEPIPDPLLEATLPNGEFRSQITTERDEAREILSAHNTDHTPFELAERFAEARYHAAVAAGTWAIVTTEGDSTSVTDGAGTVLSRADQFGEMLPGVATDPLAGAAVYGPIERWLDTADRSTLSRSTSVTRQRDPLGAGQTIGEIERVQSQIEAGKYIQSKYQETVEEPQSIDSEICSEVENLRTDIDEWVQVLYNGEDDQILRFRGIEVSVDHIENLTTSSSRC